MAEAKKRTQSDILNLIMAALDGGVSRIDLDTPDCVKFEWRGHAWNVGHNLAVEFYSNKMWTQGLESHLMTMLLKKAAR